MNYTHRLATWIAKVIGSIMTIAFSLVAFAHGQNCNLLPGWSPSVLVDGQSRTGYQIPEATFSQTCAQAAGQISCVSGSVANGNIFKYRSCTPHTRNNCTTPTTANHLQYKTLYKSNQNTYTQNCQQLSQSLQCLNWTFTWGTSWYLFTYATCTNQNRSQCIDERTSPASFKDHGESIVWYTTNHPGIGQSCYSGQKTLTCTNGTWSWGSQLSLFTGCNEQWWVQCLNIRNNQYITHGSPVVGYTANHPGIGQSCATLKKTLICNDGTWFGGTQSSLVTGCTDPAVFASCFNARTNTNVSHIVSINAYTSPTSIGTGTCNNVLHPLTCINGLRSGGNQWSLYSWCVQANTASCPNIITGTWYRPHLSFTTVYTQATAFAANGESCNWVNWFSVDLQCINGTRSGWPRSSTGCQDVAIWSCLDLYTNKWIAPFETVYRYTHSQPTTGTCADLRKKLTCINGTRTGGDINNRSPTCGNCRFPQSWGIIVPEWHIIDGYSTILWSITGVDYVWWCNAYSGQLKCVNSMLRWIDTWWLIGAWLGSWWAFTASAFPYSESQCLAGQAKPCTDWPWWKTNGQIRIWFSSTWANFPKTCNQNYGTQLKCVNGVIEGNRQTYKYDTCTWEVLVPGSDLSITDSPLRSWYIIAQDSSPQINILFKNRWAVGVSWSIPTEWFLSCVRKEASNLNVYKSNIINSFIVNPGTKVGINIRINSLFTQAVWNKTLICEMTPSMVWDIGIGDDTTNNIWSGTFEVVKADRFDLALSTSIEPISKNLESAEGAKWVKWVQNFLYNKIMNVLLPLIIIIWILSAILGFYKIMFSSEDTAVKEWTKYIIYWVIGIILIMSAKFIGQNVFDLLNPANGQIKWYEIASWLYEDILYPFIKLAIYLVLGAMFVILISRVITFLFGTDADAQKKAGTLIGWNVISMLVIIWAKQIVQAIYGQQANVVKDITNLWEVWSGILENKNIPILYQIINYALGIASLVILVIIIIQTVKLLMQPDDPAQVKNIKNSLMYMFIGILILWAGYLIVNFAIIN